MPSMTPRQRVMAALSHKQPDRVPIDLGSTTVTGITTTAYERVRSRLGLPNQETKIYDRISQLAIVEPDAMDLLGIDIRGIKAGAADDRPDIEWTEGDGFTNEWGLLWTRSDTANLYFVANAPLSGEISKADILHYPWPDPDDKGRRRGLQEKVREIRAQGDYAILLPLQTGFVQMSQLLRGFREWYSDIALHPDLICFLMDQIMEIEMAIAGNLLNEVGDLIDVLMHFDDLAIQDRTIVSPAMYRKLIEPRLRIFYEFLHSRTKAKLIHHSDGAIAPFIESLIDIGIDGLNPVQISAKGMEDIRTLKEKYGSRITFWGGVDTQSILPFGTQEEVREHVQWLVDELNQDGGFVLCSCHNILQDVPGENIITVYETALNHPIKR